MKRLVKAAVWGGGILLYAGFTLSFVGLARDVLPELSTLAQAFAVCLLVGCWLLLSGVALAIILDDRERGHR